MPHTHSRYMQNLEFFDARIFAGPGDLVNTTTGGTSALTRTAAGNYNYAISASTTTFFALNLTNMILRRTGMFEDLQEQFGPSNQLVPAASAIAGEAEIQLYRPDQVPSMAKGQQITPRPAFKVKGFRLLGFDTIYTVTGAAFGTLSSRVDMEVFTNNVAPAITNIVPLAANNLVNVVQANPYVTNYTLTLGQEQAISNPVGGYPGYLILPDQELWLELDVVTGGAASGIFYGFDCLIGYNFN
jgi:hypothetical protein